MTKEKKKLERALENSEMSKRSVEALENHLDSKDIDLDTVFGYHQALGEWNFLNTQYDNIQRMIGDNLNIMRSLNMEYQKSGNVRAQFELEKRRKDGEVHKEALAKLLPVFVEVSNDVWDGVIQKYGLDPEAFDMFKAKKIEEEPAQNEEQNGQQDPESKKESATKMKVTK